MDCELAWNALGWLVILTLWFIAVAAVTYIVVLLGQRSRERDAARPRGPGHVPPRPMPPPVPPAEPGV